MATLTRNTTDILQYWVAQLDAAKASLGIQDVWLGDQKLLPHTPSVCVVQGDTERTLVGAPRRVDAVYTTTFIVYHSKLQDKQLTEVETISLADRITAWIDADAYASGLVVHGMVTRIEPGYIRRQNTWYQVTRVTWQGNARINLGGGVV
jgi:hypothetical protein